MKKKIAIILMCILAIVVLIGCSAEITDDSTIDTADTSVDSGSVVDPIEKLSGQAVRREDGTYVLNLIGYDPSVDYEKAYNAACRGPGPNYKVYDLPETWDEIKSMVMNNDWPKKYLLLLARREANSNSKPKYVLPDLELYDKNPVLNSEQSEILVVKATFIVDNRVAVYFKYKDPIIDYDANEPFSQNDFLLVFGTLDEDGRFSSDDEVYSDIAIVETGKKEDVDVKIITEEYESIGSTRVLVIYYLECGENKVKVTETYYNQNGKIVPFEDVVTSMEVIVNNEKESAYYRYDLVHFKENPSIEWIKNFVEGKPTA